MLKKSIFLLFIGNFILLNTFASNPQAFLMYSSFKTSENQAYLETYLLVLGNSVKFNKDADAKFRGKVGIEIAFLQDGKTVFQDKYNLISPEIDDTINTAKPAFIDQQRIPLPSGKYDFVIKIADLNENGAEFETKQTIFISFPENETTVSGIELLESFTPSKEESILTKSGYKLTPFVSDFYPKEMKAIKFYCEIYPAQPQLNEGDNYLLQYYLKNSSSKKILPEFMVSRKETAKKVNVLLSEMDISTLASGNYELVVDVKNRENRLIATQKVFFHRSNPEISEAIESDFRSVDVRNTFVSFYSNEDTLREYIRSLRPKARDMERNFIDIQLESADMVVMKQYFYDFWQKRNRQDPQNEWNTYSNQVKIVQKKYGSLNKKGYSTDRGRVYLEYGAPNSVMEGPYEPSAYPYEIWHYYTVISQTNRRFVFYNSDLVTNDYELIHSDVFGEISNPRWEMVVFSRNNASRNFDLNTVPDNYGGRSRDNYKMPR